MLYVIALIQHYTPLVHELKRGENETDFLLFLRLR